MNVNKALREVSTVLTTEYVLQCLLFLPLRNLLSRKKKTGQREKKAIKDNISDKCQINTSDQEHHGTIKKEIVLACGT